MRRFLALLATLLVAAHAAAQAYPTRPVKIVVAFTAGGTTDITARVLAQGLSDRFKQPFVIENKPGAGGNLGTEMVCRAPPDGYTLSISSVGPIAVNPTLYKALGCNPLNELVAVAHISEVPNVLVVHPSLKVKTLDEFVAYAKANDGKLNYASTGIGTSSHLASYMLSSRAGFTATHIPYKGAEALKDLLAGRIQFMFATIPSVIQHIKAGNLVAIGVSSLKRSRSMPDVPTIAESGFAGFEAGSWFGIFAPRGTPQGVIQALNKASNEIIAERAVESRLVDEGADPAGGSPERFAEFVRREYEKWKRVVQESGAVVE
jgi:tripartite-type tricarboxylate transporter receptor subunit TctC